MGLWGGLIALYLGWLRFAKRALILVTFGFTFIAIFPLGAILLRPLEIRFPANPDLENVVGIIVLGGAESSSRSALWGQPVVNGAGERFFSAIALANRFPSAKLVFTGGRPRLLGSSVAKVNVAAQIFRDSGIAPERLLSDIASRSTAENATYSLGLVGNQPAGTWVLITSAYHMPRAMGTFCAAGWTNLTPWPTDFNTGVLSDDIGWNLAGHIGELQLGLKEWIGLLAYRVTGRTHAVLPESCP